MKSNNLNLGSYDNPIILKNKHQDIESEKYTSRHSSNGVYVHRLLLQLHTGNNHEIDEDDSSSGVFAFHKLATQENCYIKNVISNPYLQPLEMKVAIALFNISEDDLEDDKFVYICTSKKINIDNYGDDDDDGCIWMENYKSESFFSGINQTPLFKKLEKAFNIRVSNEKLNKILIRLDSFHYISVTPVTFENSKLSIIQKHNKNQRAYLKIIQINELMDSKNLTDIWLVKD